MAFSAYGNTFVLNYIAVVALAVHFRDAHACVPNSGKQKCRASYVISVCLYIEHYFG